MIGQALPYTVCLLLTTTVLSWIIGNAIGLLAGFKKDKWYSKALETVSMCIYPTPYFMVALVIMILMAYVKQWFPLVPAFDEFTGISNNSEIRALMEQHHVIGAFLVSTVEQPIVDAFMQTELPLLCLNHSDPRILSVLPDNQTGIAKAVSHLAAHGHRRIAFIGGPPVSHNANERLQAFIFSMNDQGLPLCPDLVFRGDWTYEGSQRIISQMFASLPRSNWPSAIIAASDMMAIGAIEAIHQNGLSVPWDISVIGFDNIDLCKLCSPQLTSVGPDARRMANIAVELMTTMLQRGSSSLQGCTVRIPVAFIERCSVGSAGVLDPSAPVSAKEQSSAS